MAQPVGSKYDRLIARAKEVAAAKTIVVHPCDETSLRGAHDAAELGIIIPILVGPRAKIENVARQYGIDISKFELVDIPHSHAAAERAVALIREGKGEMLMKGSLHTDELMRAVTSASTGLRTARRISHVFIMDVPTYPETLFITDAAINIFPDLEAKRDIIQNAIDLCTQVGLGTPRVAILSAVETVTSKIPSTIEAAALCKMADRGQITGGTLDGPLAFDNAIDAEAAKIKGIHSPVAGRAQILVVPDLEAGNMLAKNLIFLAKADSAGHRARRPRADRADLARGFGAQPHGLLRGRGALCGGAPRQQPNGRRVGTAMDTILVVNAGSSSVKFEIFEIAPGDELKVRLKGQMDGIGTQPHLRAESRDGSPLIDKSYGAHDIADVPAAMAAVGDWLRSTQQANLRRRRPPRRAWRAALRPAGPGRSTRCWRARAIRFAGAAASAEQSRADQARCCSAGRIFRRSPVSTPRFTAPTAPSPTITPSRRAITPTASAATASTACPTNISPAACARSRPTLRGARHRRASRQRRLDVRAVGGKSIESTMGFTALDGLPMGTRPGQIDPGVLLYLIGEKR